MTHTAANKYAHSELAADFAAARHLDFKRVIDSTLLKPNVTEKDIAALCQVALENNFRSVCVPPCLVSQAAKALSAPTSSRSHEFETIVCTVVGFPLGYSAVESKVFETALAIEHGAKEIDFVQNAVLVKMCAWGSLESESKAIVSAAKGRLVKVILETSLLTPKEIADCTKLHAEAGVHIIKTSTGFGARGASEEDIKIIAATLKEVTERTGLMCGIKASGGIRTRADAELMLSSGATRLGTSAGAEIVGNNFASSPSEKGSY